MGCRTRLDPERLVELQAVVVESVDRARHVQQPDPRSALADEPHRLVPLLLEVRDPVPQCLRVVLAQVLDVADFEPDALHCRNRVGEVDEFAVGEHVPADERPRRDPGTADRGNGMVEHPTSVAEQAVQLGEVAAHVLCADVLGHPDRRDRVEWAVVHLPVVLEADLDPVVETRLGDTLPSERGLFGADRDADDIDVVMGGRVECHRPPAASHVEQTRSGVCRGIPERRLRQAELSADQLVLRSLGVGEADVGGGESCA